MRTIINGNIVKSVSSRSQWRPVAPPRGETETEREREPLSEWLGEIQSLGWIHVRSRYDGSASTTPYRNRANGRNLTPWYWSLKEEWPSRMYEVMRRKHGSIYLFQLEKENIFNSGWLSLVRQFIEIKLYTRFWEYFWLTDASDAVTGRCCNKRELYR